MISRLHGPLHYLCQGKLSALEMLEKGCHEASEHVHATLSLQDGENLLRRDWGQDHTEGAQLGSEVLRQSAGGLLMAERLD